MLWSVLVCALICLCVYLHTRVCRVKWASLGLPEVPANWVWGSCTFLLKENPAHWFIRIQRQFHGSPLVGITLPLGRPALVVCSPEAAAEALRPGVCREKLLSGGPGDPTGALNIFTVKEPLWSLLRRQVSPLLTAGRVRAAAALVRGRAARLVARIEKERATGEDYNLRQILADYTTDIISVALLGVESDSLSKGPSIAREATKEMMHYDIFRGLTWSSIYFYPKFLHILRTPMFPRQAVKLIELAIKSGERAIEADKEGAKKSLGMKELLLSMQLPDEYKDIRDDAILAQAVVLIQGGFETTAAAVTFCLLELAHHQEAQNRMYNELREAKERVGGELDSATLAELPYLNAAFKESLRLFPPMGWLDRVTVQPVKLAGVPIPVGTPLFINMAGIQRDSLYFPDPDQFHPKRFLPENEHKILPNTYLPFGDGPKVCVGRRFGEQTVQYALSEIILNYNVSPGVGCPLPEDYIWERRSMLLLPGEPLRLKLTPRN